MRQNVIAFLLLFCIIMKKEILLLLTDNFILNVTIYYHNNWSCETKFVLIIHPRVVSFLRYRSKKIVIKYFNYYQLVTFNIIKVLVNIIWKTIFLSFNFGPNKKSFETGFEIHTRLDLGALKRGPCTCSTVKAFNLTFLHILRS